VVGRVRGRGSCCLNLWAGNTFEEEVGRLCSVVLDWIVSCMCGLDFVVSGSVTRRACRACC
jgi:hypothetical protein